MLKQTERVNERIKAREILVIDDDGSMLGLKTPEEAMALARQQELDLVEISPGANPPVCRIMDYGKHRYRQSKKAHEAKRKQHQSMVKEIKFRPSVDEHDFEFKKNNIVRFLQQGDKVKVVLMFRGRERTHREIGQKVLERVMQATKEFGTVEAMARSDGPHLQLVLAPRANIKVAKPVKVSDPKGAGAGKTDKAPRKALQENLNKAGEESAETENQSSGRQAVQGDGLGQGQAVEGVQVPHPDEEDAQA